MVVQIIQLLTILTLSIVKLRTIFILEKYYLSRTRDLFH